MADDYNVSFKIGFKELNKLQEISDERGLELHDLVQEVVYKFMKRTDRFYVAEPEDMEYIVFRGVPREFTGDLREAERFAADKAEETKSPWTIMSVPKVSTEIALAAVYHGVVIHALDKVQNDMLGEED